jgi:hypothetical protein
MGGVLLVGVGAPGGVVQCAGAGAPNEWRLQCERPRAEVCGCAVRQVGGLRLAAARLYEGLRPSCSRSARCRGCELLLALARRSLCFSLSSQLLVGQSRMELRGVRRIRRGITDEAPFRDERAGMRC